MGERGLPADRHERIRARDEARARKILQRTSESERQAREARAAAPPRADDHEWVPVPGFGGAYELRRDGSVRSWKAWRGATQSLPRSMRVQHIGGRRTLQLGLHGGTHDVDKLVAQVFGAGKDPSDETT